MEATFDWMPVKEWNKFHKFVQKEEDKVKIPIMKKEFTALGSAINIIQNEKLIVTILRKGRINEINAVSIPDKLKDSRNISSEKINYSKKIYEKLKEKWKYDNQLKKLK